MSSRRTTRTAVAGAALLLVALVIWYKVAPHLDGVALWPSVLIIALALMPALFGIALAAVRLWNHPRIGYAAVGLVVLTLALTLLDLGVPANFAKFAAVTSMGWVFLGLFEELSWVVLVALVIPWVDIYSVWRGPTKDITEHHAGIFTKLSIAFVVPGTDPPARLGLPDVLFFAVFLGASLRFRLRPVATWVCMTASLGITMALTTFWSSGGLPALPGISLGFLLPNLDLIWRRLRPREPGIAPGAGSG